MTMPLHALFYKKFLHLDWNLVILITYVIALKCTLHYKLTKIQLWLNNVWFMFESNKWIRVFIQSAYGKWLLLCMLLNHAHYFYRRYLSAQNPTIQLEECLKEKLRSAIISLNPSRNNLFYLIIENKHK